MPVIFYEKETEERARVMLVHSMPEQLSAKRIAEGIEIETVPDPPEVAFDEVALPYCNPVDKTMWWEVTKRELTPQEKRLLGRIGSLEQRVGKLEGGRGERQPLSL